MAADDKRNIAQLLLTLLSIPSPTGQEMALLKWLESFLTTQHFKTKWQKVEAERANLLAWRGNPKYLIATHVDTVPAWGHPHAFTPLIREDKVWARGAIDTKGQIAALLHAIAYTDTPCALAFIIDEEKGAIGSERFEPPFSFEGAIVLEPTNLSLAIAEAGNIELSLKFQGKTAHGAVAGKGKNAIEMSCAFLKKLTALKCLQIKHPLFPDSQVNIGKIRGGKDCQLVADRCEVEIDIPVLPGINLEEAWQEVLSLLNNFPVTWEIKSFDPSWEISPAETVVKELAACISIYMPVKYTGMPAWTDAAHLLEKGIPAVVFGAGDLALAHTPQEHVDLNELLTLSYILKDFLKLNS